MRFVEETVPKHLYSTLGATYKMSGTFAALVAFSLGMLLPDDQVASWQEIYNTENWRIIYFYFPVTLYIITMLGFLFPVRHESIKFLINQGRDDEARAAIGEVYKYAKSDL